MERESLKVRNVPGYAWASLALAGGVFAWIWYQQKRSVGPGHALWGSLKPEPVRHSSASDIDVPPAP